MAIEAQIKPSSVFVVSGGAKGITAQCVIRLARAYQCKWILLGRSELSEVEPDWAKNFVSESELKKQIMQNFIAEGEKPTPIKVQQVYKKIVSCREIRTTIATIQQLGSQVEYVSVDVTDAEALERELASVSQRIGGTVTGIIHGAGNLADKLIENKTERDFENVYAAKVEGLKNLLNCIPEERLEYLVLFSSVAGFFGSAGQSDYALANEILNKSAHQFKQNHPSCHVMAINWGPWDSGMVTPVLKKAFAERNIEVIPVEVGAEMLLQELNREEKDTTQIVIGNILTPLPESLDSELRNYRIRRRLALATNPFLEDYVVNETPVLPASCAAAWLINVSQQLYPSYEFSSLENFKVLKTIVFDSPQTHDFLVDIREIVKTNASDRASEIKFEVDIWRESEPGKVYFYYTGVVKLTAKSLEPYIDDLCKDKIDWGISEGGFAPDRFLFQGYSFQGIKRVLSRDSKTMMAECFVPEISEQQQGQFVAKPFNGFTSDFLVQCVSIWCDRHCQIQFDGLEIERINCFQSIPFDRNFYIFMEVIVETDTNLVVDLTACDRQGKVYLKLSAVKYLINRVTENA
jgi:NAD(P)-dependent dehydrogenase (short-subunit alcohol dehydrogenase family)